MLDKLALILSMILLLYSNIQMTNIHRIIIFQTSLLIFDGRQWSMILNLPESYAEHCNRRIWNNLSALTCLHSTRPNWLCLFPFKNFNRQNENFSVVELLFVLQLAIHYFILVSNPVNVKKSTRKSSLMLQYHGTDPTNNIPDHQGQALSGLPSLFPHSAYLNDCCKILYKQV